MPESSPSLISRAVLAIVKTLPRIFFRQLTVVGLSRAPLEGGALFVANHVNSLLDPLIMMSCSPRPVRFLAKAPLFRHPLVAPFLKAFRALPIHRRMDGEVDSARNEETLKECEHALVDGEAIALFPEGLSHDEPRLQPLRTGAARLASGASQRDKPPAIVPVGLVFSDKRTFRSSVTVVFGPRVHYSDLHLSRRWDREGIRELTERIRASLEEVTLNADSYGDLEIVERIWEVARKPLSLPRGEETRVTQIRLFLERYYQARREHPAELHKVTVRARAYGRLLRVTGFTDADLIRDPPASAALKYTAGRLLFLLATYPLALYGHLFHFVPYTLTGPFARLLTRRPDTLASMKLYVGLFLFPLFYFLQGWAIALGAGNWWALGALLTAPPAGLWALRYYEARQDFFRTAWAFLLLLSRGGLRRKLLALREELLDALEPLLKIYAPEGLMRDEG